METSSLSAGGGDLVVVAIVMSRVEAIVVSSLLDAAGVTVHAGGLHHASVEVNSLALGGHRLWVPETQHELASAILIEVFGQSNWHFSFGLRRAVLRFLGLWGGIHAVIFGVSAFAGLLPVYEVFLVPIVSLAVPVNPQAPPEFFLRSGASE